MGCDVHMYAEKRTATGFETVLVPDALDDRSYGTFAFLAGVRNYSGVTPIAELRGLPEDVCEEVRESYEKWDLDGHSCSWLSIAELLAFNYDAAIEDRRVTRQVAPNHFDGGCTAEVGGGFSTTWRRFLGQAFIDGVQTLADKGAERIVFWFDN